MITHNPREGDNWRKVLPDPDYNRIANCVLMAKDDHRTMEDLISLFHVHVNFSLNFILFSTSGVTGSYASIEEVEEDVLHPSGKPPEEIKDALTFVIVHPRIHTLRFGNCYPKTPAEFEFLKWLRAESHQALAKIGIAPQQITHKEETSPNAPETT